LISNPLVTISSSGTIISTTVSLGYNVSREQVEKALIKAAEKVDLENIFVHVVELGDFSVTYKVGGLLKDVSSLITKRSDLKKMMFDSLHEDHIEIVSPTFMNQRVYDKNAVFIPSDHDKVGVKPPATYEYVTQVTTEDVIFGKAIEAEITKKIDTLIEDMEQKQNEFFNLVNRISDEEIKSTEMQNLNSILEQKARLKDDLGAVKEVLKKEDETSADGVKLKSLQYLDLKAVELNNEIKELLERVSKGIEK
jgi:ribonuclease BN (tRNA processing enzyme)